MNQPARVTLPHLLPYPWRLWSLAFAALGLVLVLSGCQRAGDGPAIVRFWAMGREGELVQRLLPDFHRRNPSIRVEVQQIPWSAAHEKLLTAFVGEHMPDVFQLGNTWIPEFVALGALAPLDEHIESARADLFPGVLETNVLGGRTWAMPWYVDTRVLFYRRDMLAKAGYATPPRNWRDWLEALRGMKAAAGPGHYAILLPVNEWQVPVILALQAGSTLLRDGDRYGDFRGEAFRRAFESYLDLFRDGLAPPPGDAQVANLYQEFARGFINVYISGPWNIAEFARRLPATLATEWSTAPLPGSGEDYPGRSLAGGASLALFKGSAHPEAAWRLIEFLSEPQQQIEFYRLSGDLPSRMSAWRAAALDQDKYARAFWLQLRSVASTPKIPEWERISDLIARHAERAIRGSVSVDEALADLDRDTDRVLEKRRWLLAREAGR